MKIKFPAKIIRDKMEKIKEIFSPASYLTCIEISETHIKLAQFEKIKGEKRLVYLFTRNIPSQDEETVIKTLKTLLAEIKRKGLVLSLLPRHHITVRYLKLPSANPEEISAMLDFQVSKQIPYPKEEITYSYLKLGKDASGYTEILLAIVHQELVYKHLHLLRACGLEPERISFDTLADSEWFNYQYPEEKNNFLLIDIDTVYTKISVISPPGRLLFSRAIKLGMEDLEHGEDNTILENFRDEIKISLSTFMKEYPQTKIERIILTGAVAILDKLKDYLRNEFPMEIEIRLPLQRIKMGRDVLEENWFDLHRVSLNAVLGLGLERENLESLDLLPFQEKRERLARKNKLQMVFSGILIFLILSTLIGFLYKKFYEKTALLRYLNNELKKISARAQGLEEKKRNLELVRELFSDRSISLDILTELHKIVPEEIDLVSFDFEDGKGLTLRGTSTEMAAVFRFIGILDKTPYFANSQVKFVRKRVGSENLTDFEIFSPLKSR
ncbi:MAG: pilus assembly protein PilM [Candidatus Omnitrophica bacterium]|nr:pilus assembly protein PilM [Candidatus Omnitrophota bacterium]